MKVSCESIRKYRKERKLTLSELAEKSGIAQAYLSQIETGDRVPSVGVIERISKALGVDFFHLVQYETKPMDVRLLQGHGHPDTWTMHTIPLFDATVHAGDFVSAPTDHVEKWIEVPSPLCPDPEAGAVTVKGECMAPMFMPGDIVFFSANYRIRSGDVVLVGLDDELMGVRMIQYPKGDDEHALLLCVNPKHQPRLVKRAEIKVCKKVIASHRSLI